MGLLFWLPGKSFAQQVLYSEPFHIHRSDHFELIGKSENFYWVERRQWEKSISTNTAKTHSEFIRFGLLDSKLDLLKEWAAYDVPGILKQWLVTGKKGLDQITLVASARETKIICTRFETSENRETRSWLLDSLPFSANPSAYLLIRSEDQSKILLIAFENNSEDFTSVHALLFDSDWVRLYHHEISHEQFSQPCIQDDETGFPSESFDNLPIKLFNDGQWLMAAPSRVSHNFSLFHASANERDFSFHEIPVSPFYKMEDIAMSVSNERQELNLGLLSGYANTTLKNVQVFNYSLKQGVLLFDSSYHFNTQLRDIRNKNLSHEIFSAVPGGGFIFMREYGSPFEFSNPVVSPFNVYETAYLLANYSESNDEKNQNKIGYIRKAGLTPIPVVRNRGDLNLFYFPVVSKDSAWSGVLSMEQHAETNNPDLSYLLIPADDKLYLLYNNLHEFSDPLASTTTLNLHGRPTDDALIFWKMKRILNFQRARRFSSTEVAVPYLNNQQSGFAIITLNAER